MSVKKFYYLEIKSIHDAKVSYKTVSRSLDKDELEEETQKYLAGGFSRRFDLDDGGTLFLPASLMKNFAVVLRRDSKGQF